MLRLDFVLQNINPKAKFWNEFTFSILFGACFSNKVREVPNHKGKKKELRKLWRSGNFFFFGDLTNFPLLVIFSSRIKLYSSTSKNGYINRRDCYPFFHLHKITLHLNTLKSHSNFKLLKNKSWKFSYFFMISQKMHQEIVAIITA